jgi:hypothetical protein
VNVTNCGLLTSEDDNCLGSAVNNSCTLDTLSKLLEKRIALGAHREQHRSHILLDSLAIGNGIY